MAGITQPQQVQAQPDVRRMPITQTGMFQQQQRREVIQQSQAQIPHTQTGISQPQSQQLTQPYAQMPSVPRQPQLHPPTQSHTIIPTTEGTEAQQQHQPPGQLQAQKFATQGMAQQQQKYPQIQGATHLGMSQQLKAQTPATPAGISKVQVPLPQTSMQQTGMHPTQQAKVHLDAQMPNTEAGRAQQHYSHRPAVQPGMPEQPQPHMSIVPQMEKQMPPEQVVTPQQRQVQVPLSQIGGTPMHSPNSVEGAGIDAGTTQFLPTPVVEGTGIDARTPVDLKVVADQRVVSTGGAPGCAQGRVALLQSALACRLAEFLLQDVLENESLVNVKDPATAKVYAVGLLKLLTMDPGFGMKFKLILDGIPAWKKYKSQDHSLFITGTEQRTDYFLTDGVGEPTKMLTQGEPEVQG
eukprot:CAMPEP_0116844290 /NCGR_PEP_ID=MMETSP0418-20121206/12581_1 /TAXON_ID=1158023 /ORGANISM="Astrosyne radiata, Strain 13vi08-1A" /LENGTH=408 /DNA_ID=CAMNT_0004475177 /DNA_START=358 /DNA_END=1584 /DNA_ORIENTATION=+